MNIFSVSADEAGYTYVCYVINSVTHHLGMFSVLFSAEVHNVPAHLHLHQQIAIEQYISKTQNMQQGSMLCPSIILNV